MDYTITRLQDPHPKTGARLLPAHVWNERPDSMKDEIAFCLEPDGSMSIVTKIIDDADNNRVTMIIDDKPVHADYAKFIYVTEDQLERIVKFHASQMEANIKQRGLEGENLQYAQRMIAKAADMANVIDDQYELRVQGFDMSNLKPMAWMLAGKDGTKVDFADIECVDPFSVDAERAYNFARAADLLFTENAPHKWKVLFG